MPMTFNKLKHKIKYFKTINKRKLFKKNLYELSNKSFIRKCLKEKKRQLQIYSVQTVIVKTVQTFVIVNIRTLFPFDRDF